MFYDVRNNHIGEKTIKRESGEARGGGVWERRKPPAPIDDYNNHHCPFIVFALQHIQDICSSLGPINNYAKEEKKGNVWTKIEKSRGKIQLISFGALSTERNYVTCFACGYIFYIIFPYSKRASVCCCIHNGTNLDDHTERWTVYGTQIHLVYFVLLQNHGKLLNQLFDWGPSRAIFDRWALFFYRLFLPNELVLYQALAL